MYIFLFQGFQHTLEGLEEKNGVILAQLKQLETAKKEKVAKPILIYLNNLLGDYVDAVEKVAFICQISVPKLKYMSTQL